MGNIKGIYRFYWDCYRQGSLEGLFVATDDEVNHIIGQEVYFGEVLGKHSEIFGTVDTEDLQLLTENPEIVSFFEANEISIGYNPLSYYEPDESDDDEEDD